MIDIHSHILPNLDDGARDLGEAVEMARMAASDGITHMTVTPHMYNGLSHNPEPDEIRVRVESLQREIGDILKLLPGNEVHIAHDIAEKASEGRLTPLNHKNYMLIELPSMSVPVGVEALFYRLQVQGITPILVHPERNSELQRHPSRVAEFVEKGVRIQVTAMSLTGDFGKAALTTAERLLRHNCVHFLATDTHRANRRPPILSAGRDAAAKIVGEESARKMVEDHPLAVIQGVRFDAGEPVPFVRPKSGRLLSRFFKR